MTKRELIQALLDGKKMRAKEILANHRDLIELVENE